eukprot:TRINITY_DN21372_c0_g1_i1.p1 TRINITY_DN21372_c0_g1~~TRINITY_DN21372_c0_g1_i1.p1  ORF type:complete len:543 (+),score=177.37 TRINITY_DN21372_c0_g1_i1:86-1630(+)
MADATDREFVDYLHQRDVATLIDDVLAVVAEEKPLEPLSSIYKAISERVRAKALAIAGDMSVGHDVAAEAEHRQYVDAASALLELYPTYELMQPLERHLAQDVAAHPTMLHLAVKLARSRQVLRGLNPLHCSVVFTLSEDAKRVVSRTEHEEGEDILRVKSRQLRWLFQDRSRDCSWDIIAVDALSEDGTLAAAQRIVERERYDNVRILSVKDGFKQGIDGLQEDRLSGLENGILGGAALYGLDRALNQQHPGKRHVVVLADSTLSFDLAQLGIAMDTILSRGCASTVGARFGCPDSVYCLSKDTKTGGVVPGVPREAAVNYSLRHLLRSFCVPPLDGVADSDGAFFAVADDALRPAMQPAALWRACFPLELRLQVALAHQGRRAVLPSPVCWVAPAREPRPPQGAAEGTPTPPDPRRRAVEAAHRGVAQAAEVHAVHGVAMAAWQSDWHADWAAFARRLTVEQFADISNELGGVLTEKHPLDCPEPTVMRLRLEDAQALSKGDQPRDPLLVHY